MNKRRGLRLMITALVLCALLITSIYIPVALAETVAVDATAEPILPETTLTPEQTAAAPMVTAVAAPTPEPTPPPEPQTVRVLLSRLGSDLTELSITVDGSYSLDANPAMRFARGAEMRVSIGEDGLELNCGGFVMDIGDALTLTRHLTTGNNGLRFEDGGALYEGELNITIQDGYIRPILYINVEDYLRGVVPYEMSDSWPLEALKVQAVAARTYVLRKRNPSADYDVYDSTRDQAFKGTNSDYVNAVEAVNGTAGIIGMYNGDYAICYYGATNGGQTDTVANVWGTEGDFSYLPMQDDPYDVENPKSNLKTATIYKHPTDAYPVPDALAGIIKAALSEPLESIGYDPDPENIAISEVLSVQPYKPMYDIPSRVYTMLRFRVKVRAKEAFPEPTPTAAPTATPQPTITLDPQATLLNPYATVAPSQSAPTEPPVVLTDVDGIFVINLPIFDDVEDALGISINKLNNELISVSETEDSFVIESRRFGHGVGMSQRGAQWMAGHYGWTYRQILDYYYPSVTFEPLSMEYVIREPIKEAKFSNVSATPAPTDIVLPDYLPVTIALPDGAYYAEVALASSTSTLNMRAEPNTTSTVLYALRNGQKLVVLDVTIAGWAHVRTDAYEGYVSTKYIK